MLKSMTGFGRGTCLCDGREITVELRSVNHKFLDLSFRMPRAISFLEEPIRKLITQKIARGHIDIVISYKNTRNDSKSVQIDENLLKHYIEIANKLSDELGIRNDQSFSNLIRLPEVVTVTDIEDDAEEIKRICTEALTEALAELIQMRETEGEHLKGDLLGKIESIDTVLCALTQRVPTASLEHEAKFKERINALMPNGIEVDKNRLATEIAIFADKASVDEELVRIKTHLVNLREMLNSDAPVGRKADFLVQELNREFNTTGSKSTDSEIAALVISGKAEIEKMREQIQNVE